MTGFLIGLVLGAAAAIAWVNRAWLREQLSGWKWFDK